MENNENFAAEQVAENVEQTTEQTPVKTYTQEEVDAIVGKRLARKEARIRKEYDREYGELVETLKAGTGKESVAEISDTFRDFYQKKGVQIPNRPTYSTEDIDVLARVEAEDIIRSGYDDVVEEVDRLTNIGFEHMTAREKALFKNLAEHRQNAERGRELSKLGVTEDVYNSEDFKGFASKFNPNTPVRDIYDIYSKTLPKKNIKPMGSMKSNDSGDSGVKDFYSYEEAKRFSKKDFDKNPALYDAVQKSMLKWK